MYILDYILILISLTSVLDMRTITLLYFVCLTLIHIIHAPTNTYKTISFISSTWMQWVHLLCIRWKELFFFVKTFFRIWNSTRKILHCAQWPNNDLQILFKLFLKIYMILKKFIALCSDNPKKHVDDMSAPFNTRNLSLTRGIWLITSNLIFFKWFKWSVVKGCVKESFLTAIWILSRCLMKGVSKWHFLCVLYLRKIFFVGIHLK